MKKKIQANMPKGMVKIVIRGSRNDKGHFILTGTMPISFAADIVVLVMEREARFKQLREEYLAARKEKRLMRSKH